MNSNSDAMTVIKVCLWRISIWKRWVYYSFRKSLEHGLILWVKNIIGTCAFLPANTLFKSHHEIEPCTFWFPWGTHCGQIRHKPKRYTTQEEKTQEFINYNNLLEDGKHKKTWETKETTIGLVEGKETHLQVWFCSD
jgi:hypothetical protein